MYPIHIHIAEKPASGDFQIPISPQPQTPTTIARGCGEETFVPINMGTRCFGTPLC